MAGESTEKTIGIRGLKLVAFVLFGVILPIITICVELIYQLCASSLFDPFPSVWHIGLVVFIPLVNLGVLLTLNSPQPSRLRVLLKLSSAAIAISALYTILFLPLLPIAVIGVVFFGFGLLPLTPLISFVVTIVLRNHLSNYVKRIGGKTSFWPGFLLAIALLVGIDLPTTLTRLGLQLTESESPLTQREAIRWLRLVGNEKAILRHCYTQSGISTDLIGALFIWSDHINPEKAQSIYYRVTGKAYNSVPAPTLVQPNGGWRSRARNFDFDQGGKSVGGQIDDLSLSASRIDGSFDARSAVGYLEWTMVFKNDSPVSREARAQIALPPEAVISRLTLWIDGQEREAAFAGTSAVRGAYEKVVRQQRDPVLVTSAGKDRALVQLFPVPANGEMKIRIGMTIPATVDSQQKPALQLPYFHEKNFSIPDKLRHALWIDSSAAMQSEGTESIKNADNYSLRDQLDDTRLASGDIRISSSIKSNAMAWAIDSKASRYTIMQTLYEQPVKAPHHLFVVVDASEAMKTAIPRLSEIAKKIPPTLPVTLIFAQDSQTAVDIKTETLYAPLLIKRLQAFDYHGGHDNLPALQRAQALALQQTDSAVLWLHGPQPVDFGTSEPLLQASQRQTKPLMWYTYQVSPGRNHILESANSELPSVTLHSADLAQMLEGWQYGRRTYERQLERLPTQNSDTLASQYKTSDHLGRLWAHEEVFRLMRAKDQRTAAVELAQLYQLVTPVSGAVVLETKQQYDEAGLEPVQNGTVPTIPEPETWALLGVAMSVLAYRAQRAKRRSVHAPA
jgi:hypothetical protein